MEKYEKYLLERKLTKNNKEIEDLEVWKKAINERIKKIKEESNRIAKKLIGREK